MKRNGKNNILILEPRVDGHHGPYVQWMATGLVERGFQVTVVTLPESLSHPSMQAIAAASRADRQTGLRLIAAKSPVVGLANGSGGTRRLLARELAYWRLFRAWYGTHVDGVRPDVVFLPYLDYCLHAIGSLGSPFGDCPWVGLAMRPSFHYRRMGVIAPRPSLAAVKKALFMRLLRNRHLRRLLTIDEPLRQYLAARPALAPKTAFLPEPTKLAGLPDPQDAKRRLHVPSERKLILVYGAISGRKGVHELLRALADPAFPLSVDVLLAGRIAPEIRQVLDGPEMAPLLVKKRVLLVDRFIEPSEEPLLFGAADIVWLGYRGHYTASGVLVQAASAGRPILACEEGIIGWQARRHRLGAVVNPEDPAAVCSAIGALSEDGSAGSDGASDRSPFASTYANACDVLARAMLRRGAGNEV